MIMLDSWINQASAGQVTAGDTVRFKQLTLQEAAALRVKVDAQVALLGKVATGDLSSADAESQLQVGCSLFVLGITDQFAALQRCLYQVSTDVASFLTCKWCAATAG